VNLDLRYHLAWNAARRKPVFSQPGRRPSSHR
jgi:hypothetical protein